MCTWSLATKAGLWDKINPTGFRLSVTATGRRWYAATVIFAGMLAEDIKVRGIPSEAESAAVSRVLIEALAKNARITIFSARPGCDRQKAGH
jgi:small subunit ribosomal protein S3